MSFHPHNALAIFAAYTMQENQMFNFHFVTPKK
jgi:hypothetical protein